MDAVYDAQWCRIVLECGAVWLGAAFLVSFVYEEELKKWSPFM